MTLGSVPIPLTPIPLTTPSASLPPDSKSLAAFGDTHGLQSKEA